MAEVRAAVTKTLDHGFGGNRSLCHGDLGNLDFLWEAALANGDVELHAKVAATLAGIMHRSVRDGWLCATPAGCETPGLMTGLAGIGLELLRFAQREMVPSVLLLEPPRPSRTK